MLWGHKHLYIDRYQLISIYILSKKRDFEKSKILELNQYLISAVFPIVRLPWDQKTTLTKESLYIFFVGCIIQL